MAIPEIALPIVLASLHCVRICTSMRKTAVCLIDSELQTSDTELPNAVWIYKAFALQSIYKAF